MLYYFMSQLNCFLLGQQSQPTAAGEASTVVGRGSRRGGGRVLPENMTILRTRPATATSKKGNLKSL